MCMYLVLVQEGFVCIHVRTYIHMLKSMYVRMYLCMCIQYLDPFFVVLTVYDQELSSPDYVP